MRVLIDTNIIIDAVCEREPFSDAAKDLLLLCASEEIEGYISAKSIIDIRYIAKKYIHNEEEARYIINVLVDFLSVVDLTNEDCINAIFSNYKDYEDAVLIECAKRNDIDIIVTRNLKDFTQTSIKVMNSNDLVSALVTK